MDDKLAAKILNFIRWKGGKATSNEVAQAFGLTNKKASEILCKLNQRWMMLMVLGTDNRNRVYGLRE